VGNHRNQETPPRAHKLRKWRERFRKILEKGQEPLSVYNRRREGRVGGPERGARGQHLQRQDPPRPSERGEGIRRRKMYFKKGGKRNPFESNCRVKKRTKKKNDVVSDRVFPVNQTLKDGREGAKGQRKKE